MFKFKTLGAIGIVLALGAAGSQAQINNSKVAPLSAHDKVATKCKLHGVKLQTGSVPIHFGIASGMSHDHYVASQKYFPYAHSYASGGCVIYQGMAGRQAVKFCPKCRTAEKRWLAAYPSAAPR